MEATVKAHLIKRHFVMGVYNNWPRTTMGQHVRVKKLHRINLIRGKQVNYFTASRAVDGGTFGLRIFFLAFWLVLTLKKKT